MQRGAGTLLAVAVGGLLGAASRPAVLYAFWLRGADAEMSTLLLPLSAAIGLLVGTLAVLLAALVRGPWAVAVGAISGAVLGYGATILTFLPLMFAGLLRINGIEFPDNTAPLYGAAMAVGGALSGAGAALLRERLASDPPQAA